MIKQEQPRLIELKRLELSLKYQSIEAELNMWRRLSLSGQPLEKHFRQIHRIANAFDSMIGVVRLEVERLRAERDEQRFWSQIPRTEDLILEVHRTWYYFREKFAPRQGTSFGNLLAALDELVWRCYHPLFPNNDREPPLTFFSSGWSPEALFRHELVVTETIGKTRSGQASLDAKFGENRLRKLIIPLISLPWFQTTFLPEALFLAHETGHLVYDDAQLESTVTTYLSESAIPKQRLKDLWLPWSVEVFADLYAVLCLGPAFVGALLLLLARSPGDTLQTPGNSTYPPHHLRFLISLHALRHIGFAAEAAALEQLWNRMYGRPAPAQPDTFVIDDFVQSECVPDIRHVLSALLDRNYPQFGDKPLTQAGALCWTEEQQRLALSTQQSLRSHDPLPTSDPRVLMAGAQLAFAQMPPTLFLLESSADTSVKPSPANGYKTQAEFIQKILSSRTPGTRFLALSTNLLPSAEQLADTDHKIGETFARDILARWDQQANTASQSDATEEDHD